MLKISSKNLDQIPEQEVPISHIFLAGEYDYKGKNIAVGDFIFSDQTIKNLKKSFSKINSQLAPKVKIFIFSGIFETPSQKELIQRAKWFKILLERDLEVFAYDRAFASDSDEYFWTWNWKESVYNLAYLFPAGVFLAYLDKYLNHRPRETFDETLNIAINFGCCAPFASVFVSLYNNYLKHSYLVTKFREFRKYNYMGKLVVFDEELVSIEPMLGHDYFTQRYAQAY